MGDHTAIPTIPESYEYSLLHPSNVSHSHNEETKIVRIGISQEQIQKFPSNAVRTSKYEWWNFIPLFLIEEFNPRVKLANTFFLVICMLQCIPYISNTGGYPTILVPLSIVVVIDGIFAARDDISRHKADRIANSDTTLKYSKDSNQYEEIAWADVSSDYIILFCNI
jgi:hypothetical protein